MSETNKAIELGSLQELTHEIFEYFIYDSRISAGENKISCTELFELFNEYLKKQNYNIRPSIRAFGRAAVKRLPYVRLRKGTHYLISHMVF